MYYPYNKPFSNENRTLDKVNARKFIFGTEYFHFFTLSGLASMNFSHDPEDFAENKGL